jgi:hypothetical protein
VAEPALLRAVLGKAPIAVASGASWLALNLVASAGHPLGSAALSLGVLQATRGAGTAVGPTLTATLVKRGLPRVTAERAAYVLALGGMAAFALCHGAWPLFVCAFAWGAGSGSNWVLTTSEIQRLGGASHVGRLTAIDELVGSALTTASALAAGAAIDGGRAVISPVVTWILCGAFVWLAIDRRADSAPALSP